MYFDGEELEQSDLALYKYWLMLPFIIFFKASCITLHLLSIPQASSNKTNQSESVSHLVGSLKCRWDFSFVHISSLLSLSEVPLKKTKTQYLQFSGF